MTAIEDVLSRLDRARRSGARWVARCPAHEDSDPSLSIREGREGCVLVKCFAGCSTEAICAAVGLELRDLFGDTAHFGNGRAFPSFERRAEPKATFSPQDAQRLWNQARGRARDDERVEADAAVYAYVTERALGESWEVPGYGVLSEGMDLPAVVRWWPERGYRLVMPLYDLHGELVNVAARCILDGVAKRVLVPMGSRCKGTVFANQSGRELLERGTGGQEVIYLEGMTDFLAVALASPTAVLSVPGTGAAVSSVGGWATGCDVHIGTDLDPAGDGCVHPLAVALFARSARSVHRMRWPSGCFDACEALVALGSASFSSFLDTCLKGGRRGGLA